MRILIPILSTETGGFFMLFSNKKKYSLQSKYISLITVSFNGEKTKLNGD